MKTLQTLFLIALLFTTAAWFSLQGVSNATIRKTAEVPQATEPLVVRSSAPIRATPKADPKQAEATKPKPPSPFQIALEAGDLCEVSRLLSASVQTPDVYTAIIATMSPSPALQEAYGPNGPMLNATMAVKPKFIHATSELLWALKLGGLIYAPVGNPSEDPKASLEKLLELEKKDPTNAFYPFFRIYLEEKLGYSKEQLKATAAKLASSSTFDANLEVLDQEFRDATWLSPAMHYAISYSYSTTSPSYYSPVSLLRRLSEEKEFDGLKSLAELMMEKGNRARRSYMTGEYDIQQYTTGRGLVFQQGNQYPDWTQLEAEKGRTSVSYPTQPWVTDEVTGERRCDPGPYEAFFYEARENR